MHRNLRLGSLLLTTFAMILAFQNCGGLAQFSSAKEATASESAGSGTGGGGGSNGGGYEGKPYIQRDLAGLCTDKDEAKTRLFLKDGSFYLARKDCENLTKPYARVEAEKLASGAVIYDGRVLNDAEAAPAQVRTVHYCRGGMGSTDQSLGTIYADASAGGMSGPYAYSVVSASLEIFQDDAAFLVKGTFAAAPPTNLDQLKTFELTRDIAVSTTEVKSNSVKFETPVDTSPYLQITAEGAASCIDGDSLPVRVMTENITGKLKLAVGPSYNCFSE